MEGDARPHASAANDQDVGADRDIRRGHGPAIPYELIPISATLIFIYYREYMSGRGAENPYPARVRCGARARHLAARSRRGARPNRRRGVRGVGVQYPSPRGGSRERDPNRGERRDPSGDGGGDLSARPPVRIPPGLRIDGRESRTEDGDA